ncbi:hypothetical protein BZZ01_05805 [Nostocales cyanobacterium HT-58-2]|nr:hypothetical protein BZZ01_05805 [Nostocales cyanobacterium HT-58-2]
MNATRYQHRSETIDKSTQAGLVTVAPPSRISETDWQQTRNYLQQSLQVFETAQRPDLVAHLLDKLGVILRDLQDWEQLKTLAEQSLSIHEAEGNSLKIYQDYGFLAEVALANQKWRDAKKLAEKALEVLATENSSQTRSLELYKQSLPPQANESAQADFVCVAAISNRQKFLFLLAQAEQNLDEEQEARSHLEAARKIGVADHKPQLYLNILSHL